MPWYRNEMKVYIKPLNASRADTTSVQLNSVCTKNVKPFRQQSQFPIGQELCCINSKRLLTKILIFFCNALLVIRSLQFRPEDRSSVLWRWVQLKNLLLLCSHVHAHSRCFFSSFAVYFINRQICSLLISASVAKLRQGQNKRTGTNDLHAF